MQSAQASIKPFDSERASLLLVDDDEVFCQVLSGALMRRGFDITVAHSVEDALPAARINPPEYAVIDLKMGGASGLSLIRALREIDSATRIVVLTGYASVTTAVEAIKLGATQYLSKPANADEIAAAFDHEATPALPIHHGIATVKQLEWEYLQRVLRENQGNISATARALNMHRRTLQRKLMKPAIAQ